MSPSTELVPHTRNIADVYSVDPSITTVDSATQSRWTSLLSSFKTAYGVSPQFVARSPGRVNIIGEHIDYSLFDVLPAAVSVDCLIAFRVVDTPENQEPTINIANVDPARFPTREFAVPKKEELEIDASQHEWTNYFKAGMRGALRFLRGREGAADLVPASMQVLIDGNVPAGGGLSSSAAFVCASGLAVMKANKHDVSKQDLLDMAIVSERAVGVYSGGMDQAASVFSSRGFLLYTKFFPEFGVEHVPVPPSNPEFTFLIAQSFVAADKHVTAPKHYNLRVVECTLASVVLAKLHGITLQKDISSLGYSLRNFQQEYMRKNNRLAETLDTQLPSMIELTKSTLTDETGYTRESIANFLEISVADLEKTYLSTFPVQAEKFLLRQRALHVFTEASRVLAFKATLSSSPSEPLTSEKINHLAILMNETQASCRDDYDCSCPELDEICTIVRGNGGLGSRLTGAGWGGCTVHLVPVNKVEGIIEALKKEYYLKKFPEIKEEKMKEAFVVSRPGNGSYLIEVEP